MTQGKENEMFWTNEIQDAWNENGTRIQGEIICSGERRDSLISLKIREVFGEEGEVARIFTTSGFKVSLTAHKSHGPHNRIDVIIRPSDNDGEWWVSPFGTHHSDKRGNFVDLEDCPSSWILVPVERLDYVVSQRLSRRRPILPAE